MTSKNLTVRFYTITLCMICFLGILSYPIVIFNWGDKPYTGTTVKTSGAGSGTGDIMASLIQTGAGYVLKAHSDFWLVLNKVEMSDPEALNYTELTTLVMSTRTSLASAISTYKNLKMLADSMPYDPGMIEVLMQFDYNALNASRPHNQSVWGEVKQFLITGDVRGVFTKSLSTLEEIYRMVDTVYYSVSNKVYPDIKALWSLGTLFSDSHLFGQYSAEVFSEL